MTTDELFESSAHVIYLGDIEFRADNGTEFDELLESLFAFACDRVAVYAALMLATAGVYEELVHHRSPPTNSPRSSGAAPLRTASFLPSNSSSSNRR